MDMGWDFVGSFLVRISITLVFLNFLVLYKLFHYRLLNPATPYKTRKMFDGVNYKNFLKRA